MLSNLSLAGQNNTLATLSSKISSSTTDLAAEPLDSVALRHIRLILQQTLHQTLLPSKLWEDELLRLIKEVFLAIPSSLQPHSNISFSEDATDLLCFVLMVKQEVLKTNNNRLKFARGTFEGDLLLELPSAESLQINKPIEFIGGTILVNVLEKTEYQRIIRVMELMFFAVCNAVLEIALFRDLRISRQVLLADDIKDHPHKSSALSTDLRSSGGKGSSNKKRRANILSWFRNKHISTYPKSRYNERITIDSIAYGIPENSETRVQERSLHSQSSEMVRSSAEIHLMKRPQTSRTAQLAAKSLEDVGLHASNRFTRMSMQMKGITLSISPDVKYPPPSILERLRQDEECSWKASTTQNAINERFSEEGSSRSAFSSSCSQTITSDIKLALGYLMTSNNTINGTFRHQSLCFNQASYWKDSPSKICNTSEYRYVEFYRRDGEYSDTTLEGYLKKVASEHDLLCEQYNCRHKRSEHIIVYTHGVGQIKFSIGTVDDNDSKTREDSNAAPVSTTWKSCAICKSTTTPQYLSKAGSNYSFGKFLELFFYHPNFALSFACVESCTRLKTDLFLHFLVDGVEIKVQKQDVDLYDVRIPKIQVDPALVLMYAFSSKNTNGFQETDSFSMEDISNSKLTHAVLKQLIDSLRMDILEFYRSIRRFTKDVNVLISKEGTSSISLEVEVKQTLLNEIVKKFCKDEVNLLQTLSATTPHRINEIRRIFLEHVRNIELSLEIWCKLNLKDWESIKLKERFTRPEWDSPNIYIFPESWVLIRDDELSSVISFTISSGEYLYSLKSSHSTRQNEYSNDPDDEVAMVFSQSQNGDKAFLIESSSASFYEESYVSTNNNAPILDYLPPLVEADEIMSMNTDGGSLDSDGSLNLLQANIQWRLKVDEIENDDEKRDGYSFNDKPSISSKWKTSLKWEGGNRGRLPHVVYKFSEGDMHFTCTVYYATEFDALRRKCGLDTIYNRSLERCKPWAVAAGSSGNIFYKTNDDRFVIKHMVKWTDDDINHILKFAPYYFDYLDDSPQNPSLLVKIFGIYHIRKKNLNNKKTSSQYVLVLENLFFGQKVIQTFSLKGIPGRYADSNESVRSVDQPLWDGEWVDGQYRQSLQIYAHCKKVLQECINNDTHFLSDLGVVDYSLLVGVDENNKILYVGIIDKLTTEDGMGVDYVNAYSQWNSCEDLNHSESDLRQIQPEHYRSRFRDAMHNYFLAVPDKWVKTPSTSELSPKLPMVFYSLQ